MQYSVNVLQNPFYIDSLSVLKKSKNTLCLKYQIYNNTLLIHLGSSNYLTNIHIIQINCLKCIFLFNINNINFLNILLN